jgi:hypothetical protein
MRLQQSPSRWRPENREAHREDWTGPSTTESARPTTNLSQYGSPSYVCGKTKLPFARSELPDQPVQLPAQWRAKELDSGAFLPPRIREDRSSLPLQNSNNGQCLSCLQAHRPYTEADQARSDSLETRCRRRRTDPGLEAVSSTTLKLHTLSRTTRNTLSEDQMTTGQSRIATSLGQRVSGTSRTQSTSSPQREARQRQRERAPLVPEATESSENKATATTVSPKSAADTSLSPEPYVPIARSRNADSDQRLAPSTSASSSAPQQRARRPSSEHRSREISDLFQPSAASASARPRGQSSGSRHDGEGSDGQVPSSSQVYPPITERRRRRRRSSRSSERRRR